MAAGDPRLRVLYAIWAFFECLGFGGLVYGWGSLVFVLKDEGLYLDQLCDLPLMNQSSNSTHSTVTPGVGTPDTTPLNCQARDDRFNLVFTVASSMLCVGCFIMGQVNFKCGLRVTRLLAFGMFTTGALLIAFTSNAVPWFIFPGLSMVGIGGITILMTNTQVSLLFPTGGGLIVGWIGGAFDASASIQQMMKLGYENGIRRQTSYIIIAACHLLTLVNTFVFLPKDFIKKPDAMTDKTNDTTLNNIDTDSENSTTKEYAKTDKAKKDDPTSINSNTDAFMKTDHDSLFGPNRTFRQCLTSPYFIGHVVWFSFLQLRFYFFLGSINMMLEELLDDDKDQVSHYTDIMSYLLIGGIFISPMAGFVYDSFGRYFGRSSNSAMRQKVMPSVVLLTITTTLCLSLSCIILIDSPASMYAVFVALLVFRSFFYMMAAGFVIAFFPGECFGILYGILILIGGVVSFLQYAMFQMVDAFGFTAVNLLFVGITLFTYIHPLAMWVAVRRADKRGALYSLAAPKMTS